MRDQIIVDALEEIKNYKAINQHMGAILMSERAKKALTDWASAPKEGLRWVKASERLPELFINVHAKVNEWKYTGNFREFKGEIYFNDEAEGDVGIPTITKKNFERLFWLDESPAPESGEEETYTLEDVKKAHFHGWFQRERYQSQDNGGYENKFPAEWKDMDYEEHADWFCNQYVNSLSQTPNTTTKEGRKTSAPESGGEEKEAIEKLSAIKYEHLVDIYKQNKYVPSVQSSHVKEEGKDEEQADWEAIYDKYRAATMKNYDSLHAEIERLEGLIKEAIKKHTYSAQHNRFIKQFFEENGLK